MRDLKEQLKEQLGDQRGIVREAVTQAHEAARRARDDARRAADQLRIFFEDDGAVKTSKIDLGKAQIVFSDDKGELKLANVDGRKLLTVKDPQGKLLFSGPVETKEDLDKMPADVRERYDRLQQNDLPTVAPRSDTDNADDADTDDADDQDDDEIRRGDWSSIAAGFVSIVSPRDDSTFNLVLTPASDSRRRTNEYVENRARLQRGCCKNCSGIFLPLEIRVSITDTRDATGLVAHRNHCIRISAVWSNVVALGCAVARATCS